MAMTAGWICLGLEAAAFCGLFFAKRSSESAGDAIGRDVALWLGLFVLVAGGLMGWGAMWGNLFGQRGGALNRSISEAAN